MDIGAIFDWDGVIVDSSAAHEESWERLAREEALSLPPDHFKKGFGRLNAEIIPNLLGWSHDPAEIERLGHRKEALYRVILKERGLEALPGVRALLAALKDARIPCVVGSSSERENIRVALELLGLDDYFCGAVCSEDVARGKPEPEVFLKAAQKIARAPECCVVFEDSFAGLEAARRGGMKSVGVATTNPLTALEGKCTLAVRRLTDIDVPRLRTLFA